MITRDHPVALADLPQGWFNHGPQVLALLNEHRPRVVVELGTWRGASAIAMARVLRTWGGTLTCVDSWTGDWYRGGQGYDGCAPCATPTMVGECAANLVAAGVAASVRLVVATTVEAARVWTEPIDLLYVDAGHEFADVLADLEAWVPHVKPGGLIVGDDYRNPAFPGVHLAWDYYGLEHGIISEERRSPGHDWPLILATKP